MAVDLSWLGDYNSKPPGFERISETEFWRVFDSSREAVCIHKWLTRVPRSSKLYGAHLVLYVYEDNTAVGYVRRVEHVLPAKPRYFFKAAACEHDYVETRIGKCLHECRCKKCGYSYQRDSSG